MKVCFEAWWHESELYRVDHWYDWLDSVGDQSRRDHNVCVYKLNPVCSHICGSLGAGSYMRHSRPNMPVDKVVVLELIVILLRA